MKRLAGFSAALAGLFLLSSGAFAGDVKTFAGKGVDVTRYETYHWSPIRILTKQGLKENDDVVAPEIRRAVNRELQKKGYKEVASGGQLEIRCMGLNEASNQVEGFLVGMGWDVGWGWAPTTQVVVNRVNREGTLVIGLVDPKSNKPAWSGFASEALHPEAIAKTVDKAAAKLFKKLPPRK